MAEDLKKRPHARMFVALDLPRRICEDVVSWGETYLSDPALRRVPLESLHVTLAFLGDRPLSDVDLITEVIDWFAEVPVLLELGAPVGRPGGDRPRIVALPATPGPVQRLGEEMGRVLAFEGLYKDVEWPFWPHVTVARVRNEGGGSRRPQRVEIPPGPSPTSGIGWFDAVRISLYRSELQSRGARYVPLAQVELPAAGSSEVI